MTEKPTVCALILAAGYSSRMRTFKPLLPLGKSTVLEETITRFSKAGIGNIKVVVGYRAELITPILDRMGVSWVLNEEYDKGMLSSVLAGVRSLGPEVEAFLLLPVDIPFVKSKTIEAVLDAYCKKPAALVYPRFLGLRGHPPLIAVARVPKDLSYDYPGGLRAFLNHYEPEAVDVDVIDRGILMDCDTQWDYEKMKVYGMREDIPTEEECRAIWNQFHVPAGVIAHSRAVAELARVLAAQLNRFGLGFNLDLIVAAGLLHDLARGQADHARIGARLLEKLGYPRVGEVVASHMDMPDDKTALGETALVFLADKCVDGSGMVPLEERFERSMKKFAGKPGAREAILKRLNHARQIKQSVEDILGQPLEQAVLRFRKSMQAALMTGKRLIYLARHGAIELPGNEKRYIGQVDLPLSPNGRQQAERLAGELHGVTLSALYCSDLKRSAETAEIVGKRLGLPITVVPALREIGLGQWEGLTFKEVSRCFPEEFQERGRDIVNHHPPGGESFFDCAKRVIPALYDIVLSTGGDCLIVGHAGVNRIILCQALGMALQDLFEISQDYGCLNLIQYSDFAFTGSDLHI